MTDDETETTEPTFHVERGDELLLLVPQFRPSDLSDPEREVYDGLCKAGAGRFTGAVCINELAESHFEAGETVTMVEAVERYRDAIRETKEAFVEFRASLVEALAPVISDLAEAAQPLVEWRQDVARSVAEGMGDDDADSDRENSDD